MDNLIPCFQPSAIAKTVSEVLGQESIAQEHLAARSPLKSLDLNCHVRENFDDSSEDIPRVYSNLSQNTPVGVAEQLSRSDSTPVADLQQLCISTSTRVVAQQQPSIPCTPLAGQQQPSSVTPVEAQQSSSSSSTPVSVSEQSHSIVGGLLLNIQSFYYLYLHILNVVIISSSQIDFEGWAQATYDLCPLKGKATRFYKGSYKKTNGNYVGPAGVYYYLWKKLHREAVVVGFAEPTRSKTTAEENNLTELQQAQLQKLENSVIIEDDAYLLAWEALRWFRLLLFKKLLLDQIYNKIPGLATTSGFDLLETDFFFVYGNSPILLNNWPDLSDAIIHLAKKKGKETPARRELARYNATRLTNDPELRQDVALILLPLLTGAYRCALKRTSGKSARNTSWRASSTDVLNSFILQHENTSKDPVENKKDLQKKKDELKATYVAHGFELTGYVVVIGKLGAIESTHVVIGSHTYNLPGRGSLLRAVDICFKCIVALHKTFPRASTEVWSFFETEVYKVRSGPDPSLSELVGKIEMFIKSKKQAEAAKALSSNRASSSSISS
ncbi:hypothetical protein QAD02_018307 [Eretmocerus hayati]|uniref:Uncharacterized protein n=1 Tax=Eretmocerus hayati TaxID=131215 RepID=A0ACC2PL63_9HYME|nr:hypothetical protein QAD02_018307 [Eretmocerus hayati]